MNCVLAAQTSVYGMVIYTGIETRARLNSKKPVNKIGKFDKAMNNSAKGLFVLMFFMIVC